MKIVHAIPKRSILRRCVFVYPTETCYGLGCDATVAALVDRIYKIKGRDFKKPLSWIVKDIDMAKEYAVFSARALYLAKRYWPGPLTLVLPTVSSARRKTRRSVEHVDTIALRVSSHSVARGIVQILQKPVVATSANSSGEQECYSIQEVAQQFSTQEEQPDFAIDAGRLETKQPSTIVKVIGDVVQFLRQGEIRLEGV